MKQSIALVLSILAFAFTFAQAPNIHRKGYNNNIWVTYNGDHKLSEKWGFHFDGHLRLSDFVKKGQQLLFRPGVNYHLNNAVSFGLGYAYVYTYQYGVFPAPSPFPENRLWEQIQLKTQLQKVEWVSRFRLEHRFVNSPVKIANQETYEPGKAVFTTRFRLMNRFSIPLKKNVYLTAMDELMVNSGKNVGLNVFDQNRLYVGFGKQLSKTEKLELGYMMQSILRSDGIRIEKNNTIQLTLISTAKWYKQ